MMAPSPMPPNLLIEKYKGNNSFEIVLRAFRTRNATLLVICAGQSRWLLGLNFASVGNCLSGKPITAHISAYMYGFQFSTVLDVA